MSRSTLYPPPPSRAIYNTSLVQISPHSASSHPSLSLSTTLRSSRAVWLDVSVTLSDASLSAMLEPKSRVIIVGAVVSDWIVSTYGPEGFVHTTHSANSGIPLSSLWHPLKPPESTRLHLFPLSPSPLLLTAFLFITRLERLPSLLFQEGFFRRVSVPMIVLLCLGWRGLVAEDKGDDEKGEERGREGEGEGEGREEEQGR